MDLITFGSRGDSGLLIHESSDMLRGSVNYIACHFGPEGMSVILIGAECKMKMMVYWLFVTPS